MSDHPELVVPDNRIVSPAEAKRLEDHQRKYGPGGKRIRPPGDLMGDAFTREDAVKHLADTALAIGDKIYGQLAEESQKFLQEMEDALRLELQEMIRREFERRTLRGRLRAAWHYTRGWLYELGVMAPPAIRVEARVEAPRVTKEAYEAMVTPLEWQRFERFGNDTTAFVVAGGVAFVVNPKPGIIAKDSETLKRAVLDLGGETENIDDDTSAMLLIDEESVMRAHEQCSASAERATP